MEKNASMITVKPVSDFSLAKNGHGSTAVKSDDTCSRMNRDIEQFLDEADACAEATIKRMTHEEVFGKLRKS